MGKETSKEKVKLITGILTSDKESADKLIKDLTKKYGETDYRSDYIDFIFTNYYEDEMGGNILRKFISFKTLINPEDLHKIKIFTNKLEQKHLSASGGRVVNLDPGYICLGKLILATTKNQQHRIYLKNGIFAEVTLRYKNKTFRSWEWTYPDYATDEYISIFNKIRDIYYDQLYSSV
ncbi:MAG: DUF4416 family protein [Armatimonadota bacterium]